MRNVSGIGAVAGGAWAALQGLSALRVGGAAIPPSSLRAAGAVAAVLAFAAAARTASSIWRGPALVAFPAADLEVCSAAEAAPVRAAAQLRGTMGGAGHLHRGRLAIPVAAWAVAGAAALAGPDPSDAIPWVALLAVAVVVAALLPARAFFYREATGGRVVLYPAAARGVLLRSHAVAPVSGAR